MSEDERPMTLDEAARECLGGHVPASALRYAARKGDLVVERLGRTTLVTPTEIKRWRQRCRSDQRAPGSGSDLQAGTGQPSGSSRTERHAAAQDALKTILQAPSAR